MYLFVLFYRSLPWCVCVRSCVYFIGLLLLLFLFSRGFALFSIPFGTIFAVSHPCFNVCLTCFHLSCNYACVCLFASPLFSPSFGPFSTHLRLATNFVRLVLVLLLFFVPLRYLSPITFLRHCFATDGGCT